MPRPQRAMRISWVATVFRDSPPSWPGLSPQVGYTRLAAPHTNATRASRVALPSTSCFQKERRGCLSFAGKTCMPGPRAGMTVERFTKPTAHLIVAVLILDRTDDASAAQLGEQRGVNIVVKFAAGIVGRHRFEDVLGTGWIDLGVRRGLGFEVGVALVDDLGIGELELLRQHLLGALLVGDRQVIAFDRGAQEFLERVAVAAQVAAIDGQSAVEPRDPLGVKVGDDAQPERQRLAALP